MVCKFCVKGKCRSEESTCDFKTLSFDKDSISKRIDEEFGSVESLIKGLKGLGKVEKQDQMANIADKILGMKIMIETLKIDFNHQYRSKRGPLAFIKLVAMAQKYGGK